MENISDDIFPNATIFRVLEMVGSEIRSGVCYLLCSISAMYLP